MKMWCSKSVEPAVCPAAWISAWRRTFLPEKRARRAKLWARGARRGDPGTQRSNVNQLLVQQELAVTWYQAPERRVQRGDTQGCGFSPSRCSFSRLCVYSGSEERAAASPQHLDDEHVEWWQRLTRCLQRLRMVSWFTSCSSLNSCLLLRRRLQVNTEDSELLRRRTTVSWPDMTSHLFSSLLPSYSLCCIAVQTSTFSFQKYQEESEEAAKHLFIFVVCPFGHTNQQTCRSLRMTSRVNKTKPKKSNNSDLAVCVYKRLGFVMAFLHLFDVVCCKVCATL